MGGCMPVLSRPAARCNISRASIRYCERAGFRPPSQRSDNGYRWRALGSRNACRQCLPMPLGGSRKRYLKSPSPPGSGVWGEGFCNKNCLLQSPPLPSPLALPGRGDFYDTLLPGARGLLRHPPHGGEGFLRKLEVPTIMPIPPTKTAGRSNRQG